MEFRQRTRDAERSVAPVKEVNWAIMLFCCAEFGGGIVWICAASGDRVCSVPCKAGFPCFKAIAGECLLAR